MCSFCSFSSTASGTVGQRRPAETPPEQKTGPDGGPGPDTDPHHWATLPAYVQQGIFLSYRDSRMNSVITVMRDNCVHNWIYFVFAVLLLMLLLLHEQNKSLRGPCVKTSERLLWSSLCVTASSRLDNTFSLGDRVLLLWFVVWEENSVCKAAVLLWWTCPVMIHTKLERSTLWCWTRC